MLPLPLPPSPLLLSSPQSGLQRRASLRLLPLMLLTSAVLLCVLPVSTSLPVHSQHPHLTECAKQRRHTHHLGSSDCGPCYSYLQEDEEGRCVPSRQRHGKVRTYDGLDEEIDVIHAIIQKQLKPEINLPKKQSKHPGAISFQTDVKNSKTDPSKHPQTNQSRLSHAATAAPRPPVTAHLMTPTQLPGVTGNDNRRGPIAVPAPKNDKILIIMISLCVVVGSVAVILATVCYVKIQRESRLAEKVDYPAFGGAGAPADQRTTTNSSSMGDNNLAQSAQMFHYQHQKQQMISMGNQKPEQKVHDTDATSDEEEVGGDFTVYECPGLAPTGEMEVKNPLFDDSTIHYQGDQK